MKWHTEVRKIEELKEWAENPRTISDKDLEELVSSVGDIGNFDPLVINTDGTVIAGNQRLKAVKKLKQTEIEVSVPDRKLTKREVKKIGIISNRHSGEWDMDKLAEGFDDVLEEIGAGDLMPVLGDGFGEDFSLKDGDREPFRQITVTLADEQARIIQEAMVVARKEDEYKLFDNFGNENTNGNALYFIVSQWVEQKRLK